MENEGPHCRNCHTGASSCSQCHNGRAANAFNGGLATFVEGQTIASGDAFAHTNAVTTVAAKCIDGGFSFPHRTLGANMLKDELYGVDFDGTTVAVGGTRSLLLTDGTTSLNTANYSLPWGRSMTSEVPTDAVGIYTVTTNGLNESGEQLTAAAGVENLDSVCLDCHGGADSWKGDDKATYYSSGKGWELLWKGLP